MFTIDAGELDQRICVERPVSDTSFAGAGAGQWAPVGEVWASVQDMLPSRAERLAEGVSVAERPARVRMRYRTDITPDMRFIMGDRVMQIVAGPAELGRREAIEFMVKNYSVAGGAA